MGAIDDCEYEERERLTPREKFESFHRANPDVYNTMLDLALEAVDRGRERVGAALLWERMRWEMTVERNREDLDDFKLPNQFRAYYAHMLSRLPELASMFHKKKLKPDGCGGPCKICHPEKESE